MIISLIEMRYLRMPDLLTGKGTLCPAASKAGAACLAIAFENMGSRQNLRFYIRLLAVDLVHFMLKTGGVGRARMLMCEPALLFSRIETNHAFAQVLSEMKADVEEITGDLQCELPDWKDPVKVKAAINSYLARVEGVIQDEGKTLRMFDG